MGLPPSDQRGKPPDTNDGGKRSFDRNRRKADGRDDSGEDDARVSGDREATFPPPCPSHKSSAVASSVPDHGRRSGDVKRSPFMVTPGNRRGRSRYASGRGAPRPSRVADPGGHPVPPPPCSAFDTLSGNPMFPESSRFSMYSLTSSCGHPTQPPTDAGGETYAPPGAIASTGRGKRHVRRGYPTSLQGRNPGPCGVHMWWRPLARIGATARPVPFTRATPVTHGGTGEHGSPGLEVACAHFRGRRSKETKP